MAYKRLTNKNLDEYNPEYDFCVGCEHFGEPNGCNRWNGTCANYERFMETYNCLAEFEDKIEQGTLIERPPVKNGDSIWLIRAKRDYLDGRYKKIVWRCVDKIFLNNDNTFTISTLAVSNGGYKNRSIVKSTTFNKSWFLTKAEAEQKLKELQK